MLSKSSLFLKQYFGAGEAATASGRALLEARYASLGTQIPLIYAIALANFAAFHFASGRDWQSSIWPAGLPILVMAGRAIYWTEREREALSPDIILRRLRPMPLIAALLSVGWGVVVFENVTTPELNFAILFCSLTSLGSAFGLSSFPNAARMPLLFLALPLAIWLMAKGEPALMGVGICLGLVILMVLRLLDGNERGFVELVRTRWEIGLERTRAIEAEQRALAEAARVHSIAYTDQLTGLPNRRAFIDASNGWAVATTAGSGSTSGAIAIIDIDDFKPINDVFGHEVGDALLKQVSDRLLQLGGRTEFVARLGSDEFGLLLGGVDEYPPDHIATEIAAMFAEPFLEGERPFRLSAGCGVALLRPGASEASVAMMQADIALHSAKRRGRGEFALFHPGDEEARKRKSDIANALKEPAARNDIYLVYQPIFRLSDMKLEAFEALARWEHPNLGAVSPAEFVPIAEQLHLIDEMNDALIVKAMVAARDWPETVRLSVNLSAVQLCSPGSATHLIAALSRSGMDAGRLSIEVTETTLLVDFDTVRANLRLLKAAGARIVLDDFGAGYASVAYLRELRFDAIKLDGSLVASVVDCAASRQLLEGVLQLCAALDTPCIAEHIETEAQRELLLRLRCSNGQGNLLSRPLTHDDARSLACSSVLFANDT